MSDDQSKLSLLNIYEVEDENTGAARHLIGFMDPVLAGSIGLASHAMIGEFEPDPDGSFDPGSFAVNPEFLEAVAVFMNGQAELADDLIEGARHIPGERLYVVDPRDDSASDEDPAAEDVMGWFDVDQDGRIVADSFTYNADHVWFSTASGVSGLLDNREFYEFLHPEARRADGP